MRSNADLDSPSPATVRLLGPVDVVGPGGPARLVGARQRAVVGLLALHPAAMVPQWRLVDGLWGDDPPRTAVKSLHSHVARVRQALTACGLPDALVTREPGYLLAVPPAAVDAARFEAEARRGREELAAGAPERGAVRLRSALALWRDEVALADADPHGWASAEVERLAEARLAAAEDLWSAELRLGRHAAAIDELERLLVAQPLRERLVGLLMLALYRSGRHTDALAAYARLRTRLAEALGVDPTPELVRLHTQILRRDPGLDLDPAPPATTALATGGPPAPRPAQLPAPVGHFTGRTRQLADLDRLLDGEPAGPKIVVVSGLAGVGKTALAIHWGHRVAGRFPDGQLFVDLRGHEPQTALTAAAALAHLLRGLGVPPDRLPVEPAEQASLYRSLLHGKRMLVALDNAGSAETVLPLVPAGAGNLVLVTSRTPLAALTVHHAIATVSLDAFSRDEAVELVGAVLGAVRVAGEPDAVDELVRLCDQLPLALRIAAAKLVGEPGRTLRELVAALAGEDRLAALSVEGDSRSVRTVFASAYRALSAPAARLFRLLGLHPGPTFTGHLAAGLAELPHGLAGRTMAELAAAHLVVELGGGRYRFHDLIRLFAHQCATLDEPAPQRAEAAGRLVDWYLATAYAANRLIDPGRDRITLSRQVEPPFGPDHQAALAFLDGERGNLLPMVRYAAEQGHHAAAWQLTYLLTGYYDSHGDRGERIEMCRWGVRAARQTGDPAAEGLMRSGLGVAYNASRRFDDALAALAQALPLMRAAGDKRGEGHVLNNIAAAQTGLRRYEEAIATYQRSLAAHTEGGNRLGIALALNNLGHAYVQLGEPDLAHEQLSRALVASRELGNQRIEAAVLDSLGAASLQRADRAAEAVGYYRQALALRQAIRDRREVHTTTGLGQALLAHGEPAAAAAEFRRAIALARTVHDPHAEAAALAGLALALRRSGEAAAAAEAERLAGRLRGVEAAGTAAA